MSILLHQSVNMAGFLLLLLFCLNLMVHMCNQQQMSSSFGGPFRIIPYQIEQCDEIGTNEIYFTSTRINKISRTTYVYSSNLTAKIPFSDELESVADVAVWGNGGWRPHYLQESSEKACSSLKTFFPEVYNELMAKMQNATCPLPPGTYEVRELDVSKMQLGSTLPTMPYGNYRADIGVRKNGTIVGCMRYFAKVVPKKPQRRNREKTKRFYRFLV